jgi:hypothetical protein
MELGMLLKIVALTFLLASCTDNEFAGNSGATLQNTDVIGQSKDKPTSLEIKGPTSLDVGEDGTFHVIAALNDGTTKTVTSLASLAVEPNDVNSVLRGEDFVVSSSKAGTIIVKATWNDVSAEKSIDISSSDNVADADSLGLRFEPESVDLLDCQSVKMKVFAKTSTGSEKDVTSSVKFTLGDSTNVGISGSTISGKQREAKTTLTAKYENKEIETKVVFRTASMTKIELTATAVREVHAKPGILGSADIDYKFGYMGSDTVLKDMIWKVRSVDFIDPVITVKPERTLDSKTCLYTQAVNMTFGFKFVPKTSLYEGQIFELMTKTGSEMRKIEANRSIKIKVDNVDEIFSSYKFKGTQGNPDAQ